MPNFKATVSFAGKISMTEGEVRELPISPVVEDLISAGYLEKVEEPKPKKKRSANK